MVDPGVVDFRHTSLPYVVKSVFTKFMVTRERAWLPDGNLPFGRGNFGECCSRDCAQLIDTAEGSFSESGFDRVGGPARVIVQ